MVTPTARRRAAIAAAIVTVSACAATIYTVLPLARTEAAHNVCIRTLPGDGSVHTEWVLLPRPHWVCHMTPDAGPPATTDLGWWP